MSQPTTAVAAIVLAGGRSARFGSDKLRVQVHGRTLLERTIDALGACAPVVVVTASEILPAPGLVTVSEWPRWSGPCAGVAAAVDALDGAEGDAIIVPADLVDPRPAVEALAAVPCGVLADDDGRMQWLLARGPVTVLKERVEHLRPDGLRGRPASAVTDALATTIVPVPWRVCADVDRPADTTLLEEIHGTV